jgi:hypothetical protein
MHRSAEVLGELFAGFDAARLLLLLTTRPERRPGWRRLTRQGGDDHGHGSQIEIELKQLTPGQATFCRN